MRVINLTKGTFLRSGMRGVEREDNELRIRLFGKEQNTLSYRHKREATDWEVTLRIDELKRLLEVAEAQDPKVLLANAVRSQSGLDWYFWGAYTPIEWQDGKAVSVGTGVLHEELRHPVGVQS